MTRSQRYRSKWGPKDLGAYFRKAATEPVNQLSHLSLHAPRVHLYTSAATLTTTAGTPWYPTSPGSLVSVRLNVAGAPSSTLTCDVLLNGSSMFTSGDIQPTIPSGSLYGYKRVSGKAHWAEDDYIQIQLTATGSATGPMVVTIEYFTEG